MLNHLHHFILGASLPTQALDEVRLGKVSALGAFSPDALSNFQTIHGYSSGAGSYVAARENLGIYPGLIAAAALLIDDLLTAAESLSAGVKAFASAFAALWPYQVGIALVLLMIITLLNMRGTCVTRLVMSIPVNFFMFTFIGILIDGVMRAVPEGPGSFAVTAPAVVQLLTLALILHTFSSGCTAPIGIEAISNDVPAFKPPEARNARRTLIVMAILMGVLLGSLGLTQYLAVVAGPDETILSALAR